MTAPKLSVATDHGRYYENPTSRARVPSITNIKQVKHVPLGRWAAKRCAKYVQEAAPRLASLTADEIYNLVKEAPYTMPNDESATGDLVHEWIDHYIKTGAKPPEIDGSPTAQNMWRQFLGLADHYKMEFTDSEFTVWSDTYGYAGTADFSAILAGRWVLGDWKTGRAVYPDTGLQLAALANADYILRPDGTQHPLPGFTRYAVAHIRPTFARLIPVEKIEECFQAFLGLKEVFDWQVKSEDQVLAYAPKIETKRAA